MVWAATARVTRSALVALSLLFLLNTSVESFYPPQKYLPSTASFTTITRCCMCATDQSIPIDVKNLLKKMLSSRSSLEEKKQSYQTVIDLRIKGNGQFEEVLDEMIGFVDSVKGNLFCTWRLPIPIPSFRVKVGSLRRLLQSSTSIKALDQEAEENKLEKRRGLLIILGQLVKTEKENTNIRYLEAEARKRSMVNDMTEMLRRTPANLETPTYTVVESKKTWEVRKYDQFSVCSVNIGRKSPVSESPANKGGSGAFSSLAGYIFGRNKDANKMAMTTPVVMSGDGSKMSFVMPSAYWAEGLSSAPSPMDDSDVLLEKAPMLQIAPGGATDKEVLTAVLWFGGYSDKKETASRKMELLSNIEGDGMYEVVGSMNDSFLMQYNDPFQPPWSRRNEVGVTVQAVNA
jgi:hypothetical protein